MKEKVKGFWSNHKDTIKNTIIAVTVPLLVVTLMGIKQLNETIDENNLNDLFYGDDEEIETTEEVEGEEVVE
jgi:hypothetical protein